MNKKKLTVFGGGGFIGSAIMNAASEYGYNAVRGDWQNIPSNEDMGDVIFCLGVGDCSRPDDVLNSHLFILTEIVSNARFDRITYVSSTRVYMGAKGSQEDSSLNITPTDNRKLFNLSKLTAESYLEASGVNYRIVRPSNVYGSALQSPLFLPSIVRDAVVKGEVNMYVTPNYSKDYVYVDDVVDMTLKITKDSQSVIYNIASGENVSAASIASILKDKSSCTINWHNSNCLDVFPQTDISKIKKEFRYVPLLVENSLEKMIDTFKRELL